MDGVIVPMMERQVVMERLKACCIARNALGEEGGVYTQMGHSREESEEVDAAGVRPTVGKVDHA